MQIASKTRIEEKVRIIDNRVSDALGHKSSTSTSIEKSHQNHKATTMDSSLNYIEAEHHTVTPNLTSSFVELGEFIESWECDPAIKV